MFNKKIKDYEDKNYQKLRRYELYACSNRQPQYFMAQPEQSKDGTKTALFIVHKNFLSFYRCQEVR